MYNLYTLTFIKKTIKIFGYISLVALLVLAGSLSYLFSFYYASDATYVSEYDCIVVFGAAVWPGGVPSDALLDRTNTAISLYKRGVAQCLVFSGANSVYGRHEVDVMLDIARERKIRRSDIETDYYGLNTKKTIDNLQSGRSYLFVSNDFHLARISLLAKQRGLKNYGMYKSVYEFGRYRKEPFLILRETVAFWYYVFVG